MRMALLLCLTAVVPVLSVNADESNAPKYPEIKHDAVRVAYHRFMLLRYHQSVIALHIMPDPQMGSSGIAYRWFHLTDGTNTFFRPTPKSGPDTLSNSAVRTGTGETYEGEFYFGSGQIKAGPVKIEWSQSGPNTGWLYLGKVAESIEIYPQQFEQLQDASGTLDDSKWISIVDTESSPRAK